MWTSPFCDARILVRKEAIFYVWKNIWFFITFVIFSLVLFISFGFLQEAFFFFVAWAWRVLRLHSFSFLFFYSAASLHFAPMRQRLSDGTVVAFGFWGWVRPDDYAVLYVRQTSTGAFRKLVHGFQWKPCVACKLTLTRMLTSLMILTWLQDNTVYHIL